MKTHVNHHSILGFSLTAEGTKPQWIKTASMMEKGSMEKNFLAPDEFATGKNTHTSFYYALC